MIIRLFFIFLLIGRALSESCTTVNNCDKPYHVCRGNSCERCNDISECVAQHSVRKYCTSIDGNNRCRQCTSSPGCTGSQVCVTDDKTYLCANTCTGPSATCTATSQCIYINKDSGNGGNFYCLSCENDSDCRKWSGDSSSTCSSGKCSPAFVSCSQDSHCTSLTASDCTSNVCKPCSQDLHCTRFTDTPLCDPEKGKCVKCKTDANCTELSASECSSGNCVPCTSNTSCARFNSTPLCSDPSGGTCVQCVYDSDCSSKTAARCSESNTCVPCTGDSECSHFSDTKLCNDPTGASGGGKCVQCINHTNCTSPAKARCSSGTCDKCTANDQCARFNTTPVCSDLSGGTCVQCVHDSDCPTEAAAKCVSYACVPCTEDDQCARFNTTPVCSSHSGGTCVQCVHHSNCSSETAARCSESNTCVPCTGDSECSHFSDTKLCNDPTGASGGGKCVQCINHTNCTSPAKARCSSGTCDKCTANDQCARFNTTPVCSDLSGGTCVQCVHDSDCPTEAAAKCVSYACVPCTEDDQCARFNTTPVCSSHSEGTCVQCVHHSNCSSETAARCAGNICVPCTGDSECLHFEDTQLCNDPTGVSGEGRCVQCINHTNCTSPELAQCASNTCTTCTDSSQCTHLAPNSLCNTTTGECVECLSIFDCTGGKICSPSGVCVGCTSSTQCTFDEALFCNTTTGGVLSAWLMRIVYLPQNPIALWMVIYVFLAQFRANVSIYQTHHDVTPH